jgi:hypothetical protein
MYKLLVIGIVFLLGFYFIYRSNDIETFTDKDDNYKIADKCPDVLIQKGAAFFLYNSKRANVPGINPIRFDSLDEYSEFIEWQRSQGILCPILYLQHAYDAQGEPVYKVRPSPTNMQGGQPDYYITQASLSMPPVPIPINRPNIMPAPANVPIQGVCSQTGALLNTNYPGYDEQNQTIGLITPLDKMFHQTVGVSPNPMDDNWGGVEYTENLVRAGRYKDNEITMRPA